MVQVELIPEVEKRLKQLAEKRGVTPEAYVSRLVEDATSPLTMEKHITKEQMQDFLNKMAALGEGTPPLPDYAYTRESFYEDHD
jgi:predicted DNA-binding protein